MRRRAFSLIEMLLATVLVAVLMGGVLMLLSGVNRDVLTMRRQSRQQPQVGVLLDLLSRDVSNAETIRGSEDGRAIELVGNVGISRPTLSSDGRLARVLWRVDSSGSLRREQLYLDDRDRPLPWGALASTGQISALSVVRESNDSARGRLIVQTTSGTITRELRLIR